MTVTSYQLWDFNSGNCIGAYAEEAAALADVRAGVSEDGMAAWLSVGLLRDGILPGGAERIVSGPELIERALSIAVQHDTVRSE